MTKIQDEVKQHLARVYSEDALANDTSLTEVLACSSSIESLRAVLGSNEYNEEIQSVVCWLMGQMQVVASTKDLMRLMAESNRQGVVLECGKSLGLIGNNRAISYLINILTNTEEDTNRRISSIVGLRMSRSAKVSYEALLRVALDISDNPTVRSHAIEALGEMRANNCVNALIGLLSDESIEVRFWTIYALGQLRAKEALPHLSELARTDFSVLPGWHTIREEALAALEEIRKEP